LDLIARLAQSNAPDLISMKEELKPLLETALRLLMSEIYLCDRQLATRWTCSIEVLQKLRRLKRGPTCTRLSAGLVRTSLYDVIAYELKNRSTTVVS
jgi:hypothetical protein